MALYEIMSNGNLSPIFEKPFKFEKDVQKLTESNLRLLLGLDVVRSEFSIGGFRIDTLAFDGESSAFVIIELKNDKNFSVVDQGYAYLSLLLNNKADFILEYNERMKNSLKKDKVNWSQSRVIFISPMFTPYQREAINFKDLPIELWEVKRYGNNTMSFAQIKPAGSQESIKTISRKAKDIEEVTKQIVVYSEQDHLMDGSEEIQDLYDKLKRAIIELGEIDVKPKQLYLAFTSRTNVVDVHIQRHSIKMWLNLRKGELDDPKALAKDVSLIGHWGNGDYQIQIWNDEDLEYIMSLVKQSLKKNMR